MGRKRDRLIQINASISKTELKILDKSAREAVDSRSGYVRTLIAADTKKYVKK